MKIRIAIILIYSLLIVNCNAQPILEKPSLAKVENVEDVYFGKTVVDPYRYMENLDDPYVQNWFKEQSDYSREVLDNIPVRQSLIDKMWEFDKRKSERISYLKITENDHYFYLKTTPEDETGKLYHRIGYEGEEELLYDPETFSEDTTKSYVISSLSPSLLGSKIAFEVAPNGSESSTMLIIDVKKKKLYDEQIDRCWFSSPSWLVDEKSFLYNRLNSADVHDINRELDSKVYLHFVGSNTSKDKEIFSRAKFPELEINPEDIPVVRFDNESNYLFGYLYTANRKFKAYYTPVSELNNDIINWKKLFSLEDEVFRFSVSEQNIYVYTPKNAPNFRILKTSLINPDLSKAEVIVEEEPNRILTRYTLTKDALYYVLSKNGVQENLYRLPLGSKNPIELELPFSAGTIGIMRKGIKFNDVWVYLMGWTSEYQRYKYQSDKNEFKLENLSSVAEYPEYKDLIVEELMVPSHDGVEVPLSIIYKKGLVKNGNNPVLISGYGSYGYSSIPRFYPRRLIWALKGGISVITHVRGGGELGDKWHKAGYKATKPNTWKDLISCTEYLIKKNYTSSSKIAIIGGSAGGILVGRAMTERPDLFAAAIPLVGCMNTVRMEESPNGPVNATEFGTVKDSVECMALLEMDAFHHLVDGEKYPATLVTAGMNDPRVIAWEPAKFAARLQKANASENQILFWADYDAGHGIGDSKTKQIESIADILSFALWQTSK